MSDSKNSPNIILIVLDTFRSDRIFTKFDDRELTPFLKSLFKNALIFENCIAPSPWTLPSHISMFTGLFSSQLGYLTGNIYKIEKSIPVLAELLKSKGYYTICYTENSLINDTLGLTRGFDLIQENVKKKIVIEDSYIFRRYVKILYYIDLFFRKKVNSERIYKNWLTFKRTFEKVILFLVSKFHWKVLLLSYENNSIKELNVLKDNIKSKLKNQPAYIFFNLMATHTPYLPPKDLLKKFNIETRDFKKLRCFLLDSQKYLFKVNLSSYKLSKRKRFLVEKLYNASVFYADLLVSKITSLLKDLGLFNESYVIITSDHGEHLANVSDHFLWEHQTFKSVYDALIKVPLIIFNKRITYDLVKKQVQLKDIFHTILQLAGLDNPKKKNYEINSSIITQTHTNSYPKYIFGEYLKSKLFLSEIFKNPWRYRSYRKFVNDTTIIGNIFFLRSNSRKLIRYKSDNEELYNLDEDPFELNQICPTTNEHIAISKKMDQFQSNIHDSNEILKIKTNREKEQVKEIIRKLEL